MAEDFSIATVLLATGWCLFVRRGAWRCGLDRALTVSVVLVGVGTVLTSPLLSDVDTNLLMASIGVQHFDDYLGHVCYLAALCTVSCAVLVRTVPDRTAHRLMRWRVEYPATAGAAIMLVLVTSSPRLRTHGALRDDFFEVDCGPYLHAYWTVYVVTLVYLMGYLIRLLWVLRRDPRSRQAANLYLLAGVLGIVGAIAEFADTWSQFIDGTLWVLLTAPAVVVSIAAALSWRRRAPTSSSTDTREDTPPSTPKITT